MTESLIDTGSKLYCDRARGNTMHINVTKQCAVIKNGVFRTWSNIDTSMVNLTALQWYFALHTITNTVWSYFIWDIPQPVMFCRFVFNKNAHDVFELISSMLVHYAEISRNLNGNAYCWYIKIRVCKNSSNILMYLNYDRILLISK